MQKFFYFAFSCFLFCFDFNCPECQAGWTQSAEADQSTLDAEESPPCQSYAPAPDPAGSSERASGWLRGAEGETA